MEDDQKKIGRRIRRQRNLAHKDNPYKSKGHSHKSVKSYKRRKFTFQDLQDP